MLKKSVLWGLTLLLAFHFNMGFAEDTQPVPDEGLAKFHELLKKHNASREAGEVAEYSLEAKTGPMVISGNAVAIIKEIKKDGTLVLLWKQTLNVMGQEQTNSTELAIPNPDNVGPDSKFEFSTGDTDASGTTYKDCDIVTITDEAKTPAGPVTTVIKMYFATGENSAGMVRMEQVFGEQGSYAATLTKPYAKPKE